MFSLYAYLLQHERYLSIFGILFILGVAFLFSRHKRRISFKLVCNALLMQFALAFFILRTDIGITVFQRLSDGFKHLYGFAGEGTGFVFGLLADKGGPWGFVFAINVASIIIFFGALMAVLYHLGIIQFLVRAVAFFVQPLLGTSGAETLCATANSMLGQTEAPLLIRHYIGQMTNSEVLVVMVSGFATLSGSILAVYGSIGVPMMHLLSASVMAIPGSLLIAKILIPETELPQTIGGRKIEMKRNSKNILDAIATGTVDGLKLAANVLAMLITFISLIAMINFILSSLNFYTLNDLFAKIFAPFVRLLGVPREDAYTAGVLIGEKIVVNEFVAYTRFVSVDLSERARVIMTYALCGFSNFSCIGIQIGGIGALAPEKRLTLTRLGMIGLLGGTLANFLNAAIASLLI